MTTAIITMSADPARSCAAVTRARPAVLRGPGRRATPIAAHTTQGIQAAPAKWW